MLLDVVYVGPIYREALQSLARRWNVPLLDGRATFDEAYDRIEAGVAYRDEAEAWRSFYVANVVSIRPVYFVVRSTSDTMGPSAPSASS